MNKAENQQEGEIDIQKMRGYISYCKAKCTPRLTPEATEKLSSHFVEMRAKVRSLDGKAKGSTKNAIPVTVRYSCLY